jgi:hypothetical protein
MVESRLRQLVLLGNVPPLRFHLGQSRPLMIAFSTEACLCESVSCEIDSIRLGKCPVNSRMRALPLFGGEPITG